MKLYRDVYELNENEILELKNILRFGCNEREYLDDDYNPKAQEIIDNAICDEDVPTEFVYYAFSGYDFVEEDFWCNCNNKTDFTNTNFIDDKEKISDLLFLSKEQFLNSYSYLTEEEYDHTIELIWNKIFSN